MAAASSVSEKARIDQIIGEFFVKSLHIILCSRISQFSVDKLVFLRQSSNVNRVSDKWFNLDIEKERKIVDLAEPWRRNFSDPMVIDILLHQTASQPRNVAPKSTKAYSPLFFEERATSEGSPSLVERWIIQFEKKRTRQGSSSSLHESMKIDTPESSISVDPPLVYKHAVILLRSLHTVLRLLPCYKFSKLSKSQASSQKSFSLSFRMSPTKNQCSLSANQSLPPVVTPFGLLTISVAYQDASPVASAIEIKPPIFQTVISDYIPSIQSPSSAPSIVLKKHSAPFRATLSSPRFVPERREEGFSPPCVPHSLPRAITTAHLPSFTMGFKPPVEPEPLMLPSPSNQNTPAGASPSTLLEDDELSLPFAVDSDEDSLRRQRSIVPGTPVDKNPKTGSVVRQLSQDAALGVLVRTLKSAPPLRSGTFHVDSSGNMVGMSPLDLGASGMAPAGDEDIEPSGVTSTVGFNPSLGLSHSRKSSSDVLEELKQYREIKDSLLRRRGSEGKG